MKDYFSGHGILIDGVIFLSPKDALPFLERDAVLVDLRDEFETNGRTFTVPHIIHIAHQQPDAEFLTLPKDRPLILADCVGQESKLRARFLIANGYEAVAVLNGGMIDWERDGMPAAINRDEELVGSCICQMRPRRKSLKNQLQ